MSGRISESKRREALGPNQIVVQVRRAGHEQDGKVGTIEKPSINVAELDPTEKLAVKFVFTPGSQKDSVAHEIKVAAGDLVFMNKAADERTSVFSLETIRASLIHRIYKITSICLCLVVEITASTFLGTFDCTGTGGTCVAMSRKNFGVALAPRSTEHMSLHKFKCSVQNVFTRACCLHNGCENIFLSNRVVHFSLASSLDFVLGNTRAAIIHWRFNRHSQGVLVDHADVHGLWRTRKCTRVARATRSGTVYSCSRRTICSATFAINTSRVRSTPVNDGTRSGRTITTCVGR